MGSAALEDWRRDVHVERLKRFNITLSREGSGPALPVSNRLTENSGIA